MQKSKLNKNTVTWILILSVLALAVIIPIELPHNITIKGKIYPAKEWMLVKGPDGELMTSLFNYKKGVSENFGVTQFERGDAVVFSLSEHILSNTAVSTDDTIGSVYSNTTEQELINLRSELAVDSALLKVNISEEKEAVVRSEEQRLEYAEKQLEEQQKLFRRQKSLYEKNLISEEEYEVAEGAIELFKINVEIAKERLKTVSTGAKKEEVNLVKSRIEGLKNRIDNLERKFSDLVIQTPVSGIVNRGFSGDTLLTISDTTDYISFIPVKINDYKYIKARQKVVFENLNNEKIIVGEIESIDKSIKSGLQSQYFLAAAVIKKNKSELLPGLVLNGEIIGETILLREYLFNLINIF